MLNQKDLLIVVISFAAIHIVVTFSAHALFQSSAWEYKTLDMPETFLGKFLTDDTIKAGQRLEKLGRDGWEAYTVIEYKDSIGSTGRFFYLKRPL